MKSALLGQPLTLDDTLAPDRGGVLIIFKHSPATLKRISSPGVAHAIILCFLWCRFNIQRVLYHITQKATSPQVNPVIALQVTYAIAFILTLPLLRFFPLSGSLTEALRRVNWASFGLAIAIVGLEIGFLLAYRSGWTVNVAAVAVNVSAAIVLVPMGITLFKEQPSLVNIMGVVVCVLGLVMVNVKQ